MQYRPRTRGDVSRDGLALPADGAGGVPKGSLLGFPLSPHGPAQRFPLTAGNDGVWRLCRGGAG